ncbi:10967_t:CDS:2, partial [Dentiscutata heterogama]
MASRRNISDSFEILRLRNSLTRKEMVISRPNVYFDIFPLLQPIGIGYQAKINELLF